MDRLIDGHPFAREVQSAITSVSFPRTLERVRAMGTKWNKAIGRDWITDMDVLLNFPAGEDIVWIAPKWLTEWDLLFFYHTKSAGNLVRKLQAEAKASMSLPGWRGHGFTTEDRRMLLNLLDNAVSAAKTYSGTIFGFAVVSGRPQRLFDEDKHFKGTIYAPLDEAHIFRKPLAHKDFRDVIQIGQNTTTPLYSDGFSELRQRLRRNNYLPDTLKHAVATSTGLRDVTKNNWTEVSCRKDARFINEAQLRTYLLDYLLGEIRDFGSTVYAEGACFRSTHRSGIADYFVRLGDRWVPVEAKLNILVEGDISLQAGKYVHVSSFVPTKGPAAGKEFHLSDSPFCLIVDWAGIYLVKDGTFIGCGPDTPIFKRESLNRATIPDLRKRLITLLEET